VTLIILAEELIALVLKLVEPEKAKELLDDAVVKAANIAAELEEQRKFG